MYIEENLSDNDFIQQIGNNAVRKAQRDSLENGIPNVYSKNGFIYYQLVDGSITMDSPFETKELKSQFKLLSQK
jgi:hypothetical protein